MYACVRERERDKRERERGTNTRFCCDVIATFLFNLIFSLPSSSSLALSQQVSPTLLSTIKTKVSAPLSTGLAIFPLSADFQFRWLTQLTPLTGPLTLFPQRLHTTQDICWQVARTRTQVSKKANNNNSNNVTKKLLLAYYCTTLTVLFLGAWLSGFFDKDSFTETLAGWAKTVVRCIFSLPSPLSLLLSSPFSLSVTPRFLTLVLRSAVVLVLVVFPWELLPWKLGLLRL